MKRILLFALVSVMTVSCGIYSESPRSTYSSFIDFRPYLAEGFYVSNTAYPGECAILGELMVVVTPKLKEIRWEESSKYDAIVQDFNGTFGHEFIDAKELLDTVVPMAKEKGANGLSNLLITKSYSGNKPQYTVKATCILINK